VPYKFLEDMAIADVAFEASGATLRELFESAALAVTGAMVEDVGRIKRRIKKSIEVTAENVEMLLFSFLQELIFYKDAELLLFNTFHFDIIEQKEGHWYLGAEAYGEKIDPQSHELLADVKAVSLHNFAVEAAPEGWRASVILDV
jgi:SHS2 domain-containing protein